MLPGFLAIEFGFEGPNYSISTACATANHCLIEGAHMIDRGEADIMIVGGSEFPVNLSGMGGLRLEGIIYKRRLQNCITSMGRRPGWFCGREGAAVLILEREAHARARGSTNSSSIYQWNNGL